MATQTAVVAPLPPAPVPAPDAWPGASKDKISRKILAINTWRAEVASQEDGITCACSNGFFSIDGAAVATGGSESAHSRPRSCEVCQRLSSSAADDSSNTNGNGKQSRGSTSRTASGGLGSVRRVLRRLGTGHKSKTSTPPTTFESQMSTAGTRMYTAQQEIANAAGEDSDDEGSSEEGGGLKGKEARLRRAQKLLAKHNHHRRGLSGVAKGGADSHHGQEPVR